MLVVAAVGLLVWRREALIPYRASYDAEGMRAVQPLVRGRTSAQAVGLEARLHFWVEGFPTSEFLSFRELVTRHGFPTIDTTSGVLSEFHSCMEPDEFDEVLLERRLSVSDSMKNAGAYDVYFLRSNDTSDALPTTFHPAVVLGRYRAIWVSLPSLSSSAVHPFLDEVIDFFQLPPEPMQDEEQVLLAKPSYHYVMSFSLVNMVPDAHTVDWEVESIVDHLLTPFYTNLSTTVHAGGVEALRISVETEIVHHGNFPDAIRNNQVTTQSMERLLIANDWRFVRPTVEPGTTVLHYLILVPSPSQCPVTLIGYDGEPVESNAFLIPTWGGVVIHCPGDNGTLIQGRPHRVLRARELLVPFTHFLTQTRQFLGVSWALRKEFRDWTLLHTPGEVPAWESDRLHKDLAYRHVQFAVGTLHSLNKLLAKWSHIPIPEDIAQTIRHSLKFLQRVREGGYYGYTLLRAQLADRTAQSAFFDPALLPQLYFPNEHRLAVFVPFFLPMLVSLLVGCVHHIKKWWRERKAAKKKEKEEEEAKKAKEEQERQDKQAAEAEKARAEAERRRARTEAHNIISAASDPNEGKMVLAEEVEDRMMDD